MPEPNVYDDYYSKPNSWRMVAVTRPCFVPLWHLLCELPRSLRPHWLMDLMTCDCESCFEHASTWGETVGHGFWHWTSHEPVQ